ncbi:uncharacterized protein LOC107046364 [Diachasma alloeum]|uniref:uncharacterized protein LOC107046364 n=1 Tax=Diachasma alloeum TaxID=454923 RepID=UPI0007383386|nr:uncharacterized protein LOC107046364 [Diachasma alloeum]
MDNKSKINMWPIQMRVVNIEKSTPIIVGIFRGLTKPACSRDFFSDFISEWKNIQEDGGITIEDRTIKLCIRCVIADAPARAFLLCHVGHRGYNNCSKCTMDETPRTDVDYAAMTDESHHHGPSFLADLGIGMVSQVAFEWMHLSLLGTTKRQIRAAVTYNRRFHSYVRLDDTQIDIINSRMRIIAEYTPREFSRRPTDIRQYHKMKATELRQLILYTGPVINHGVYKSNIYYHYLLYHVALRYFASPHSSPHHVTLAGTLMNQWVKGCSKLYGEKFVTYNAHGHLHMVEDVRRFGYLDSFSAFPYENLTQYLRRMLRKPAHPLQQIARRIREKSNSKGETRHHHTLTVKSSQPHSNGPRRPDDMDVCSEEYVQYNLIKTDDFTLGTNQRDNCCILNDSSVCLILNIFAAATKGYQLAVQKFRNMESWFPTGLDSTEVGSFKCSKLEPTLHYVDLSEIVAKCYRTP